MKKEIRLMLEYQCYPIWIYDENGNFVDNDLVKEIQNNRNLINLLEDLQQEFDSLYLDNQQEFKYIGFKSSNDKVNFQKKIDTIYNYLNEILCKKYNVKNMIDISRL